MSTGIGAHRAGELSAAWTFFADHQTASYSPTYCAIARAVAADDEVLAVAARAPRQAHTPLLMMAAVQYLLLVDADHPLRAVYAGRRALDDAPALFRDFCLTRSEDLVAVMASHRVQTNECGRSALVALGLSAIAERFGPPQILVDAGASAGLNLLYDRYHLDYGAAGSLGDPASKVHIQCALKDGSGLPASVPSTPVRIGLDREPIDASDTDGARWLLACTWPDTGRLERTAAALALAAAHALVVRTGDMTTEIPTVLEAERDGLAVVLTSWAFEYLDRDDRARFVESLRNAATHRPVVWLALENAGVVDLHDQPTPDFDSDIVPSVMGMVGFFDATDGARSLAFVHPHGAWLRWTPHPPRFATRRQPRRPSAAMP